MDYFRSDKLDHVNKYIYVLLNKTLNQMNDINTVLTPG